MAKAYAWMTLLVPGTSERLMGRLAAKGYVVGPIALTRALEYYQIDTIGSVLSFAIEHPDVVADAVGVGKTEQQKLATVVREACVETGMLFHSLVVSSTNAQVTWESSNISKTMTATPRRVRCNRKDAMRNYESLSADEQRQVDDELIVRLLNTLSPDEVPAGTTRDDFNALQDGTTCGCKSCLQPLKDALKQRPMLSEFLLVKANELKGKVYIPDPGDFVVTVTERAGE